MIETPILATVCVFLAGAICYLLRKDPIDCV